MTFHIVLRMLDFGYPQRLNDTHRPKIDLNLLIQECFKSTVFHSILDSARPALICNEST